MDLAFISLEQVFIMFIMIIFGFILVKLKLLDISSKKSLSNILVYLVVPMMIINSYITTYDNNILNNLLLCFLISFIVLIIGIILIFIFTIKWKISDKRVLMFGMMFSNAAYMGFPLIEAMFGSVGLIYASGFVSVFNILLWTIGYMNVSGTFNLGVALKSILKTPVLYALAIGLIIFFLQIPIPSIIKTPLSMIGSMNTPLSMIITGMIIASCNIKEVIKNIYLWLSVVIRIIIVPLIMVGVLFLIKLIFVNIDLDLLKIVFILEACPCAAITSIFAIKFNYNSDLAAGIVVVSTVLSIITLPLFTMLISVII